jgi:hypothetical protein
VSSGGARQLETYVAFDVRLLKVTCRAVAVTVMCRCSKLPMAGLR